jgi:hypothetical protein
MASAQPVTAKQKAVSTSALHGRFQIVEPTNEPANAGFRQSTYVVHSANRFDKAVITLKHKHKAEAVARFKRDSSVLLVVQASKHVHFPVCIAEAETMLQPITGDYYASYL